MQMTKQELTEQTIAVWQPRTQRRLSHEDAREITENLTGFFSVLAKWSQTENSVSTTGDCVDAHATGGRE